MYAANGSVLNPFHKSMFHKHSFNAAWEVDGIENVSGYQGAYRMRPNQGDVDVSIFQLNLIILMRLTILLGDTHR